MVRKLLIFLLFVFFMDFLLASFIVEAIAAGTRVYAEEAASIPGLTWADLIKTLLENIVVPLLLALVSAVLGLALNKLRTKWGLQVSIETEKKLNALAENAVQMVAERAAAFSKQNMDQKVSSISKLQMAIGYLQSKVPKLTNEEASKYVHAALARIPDEGATGDKSLAPCK